MIIKQREKDSKSRLEALKTKIAERPDFPKLDDLCVYVTGSYGRGEASAYSDLDLFFIHRGSEKKRKVSNRDKALLDADLIRVAEGLGFPAFTKGGLYLKIHYLDDVVASVGSQTEDFLNSFTARMLLLTESRPIVNVSVYDDALKRLIDVYFRDYHDHAAEFRPTFLVNDIIRYWKTMCLNYEHVRNPTLAEKHTEEERRVLKNKAHVKNLKLKFSRMLTCFSFVVAAVALGKAVAPDGMLKIARATPLQRLDMVAARNSSVKKMVNEARQAYDWFLNATGHESRAVEAWIGDEKVRQDAFERGRKFDDSIYGILKAMSQKDAMRYVVV
jgi:predicted nucleotidyltransferase